MELPTEQVLFLYDRTMYKGGPMSRVFQLSSLTRELLYQIAGHMFTVALVIQNSGASQLTEAQISNEIYHCLRHIRLNEHTRKLEVVKHHGIEQWQEQLAFFDGGYGYVEDAPNLFDEKIYPAEETGNAAAYLSKTAK